jgi:hypothetical protein
MDARHDMMALFSQIVLFIISAVEPTGRPHNNGAQLRVGRERNVGYNENNNVVELCDAHHATCHMTHHADFDHHVFRSFRSFCRVYSQPIRENVPSLHHARATVLVDGYLGWVNVCAFTYRTKHNNHQPHRPSWPPRTALARHRAGHQHPRHSRSPPLPNWKKDEPVCTNHRQTPAARNVT